MTMTTPDHNADAEALRRIEALLDAEQAAGGPDSLPDALMARIMADAVAEQPRSATAASPAAAIVPAAQAHPPLALALALARIGRAAAAALRGFSAQLGGAPALASLGAVGLAGIWLGAYPPDAVLFLEEAVFGARVTLDFAGLVPDLAE